MTSRRSIAGATLAVAVLLGITACGPAGGLAPELTALPESVPVPSPTATTPAPMTTTEPAASASPPATARTPPPVLLLPTPHMEASEVPTSGLEPAAGSRHDFLVTCEPRIPMWLDDGDGQRSWESADRDVECEEGMLALLVMGVRFEESRLLTLFEDDLGVPLALRRVTGEAFDESAVAAVLQRTGTGTIDLEMRCYDGWTGSVQIAAQRAECTSIDETLELPGLQWSDALTALEVSPGFERQIWIYPSR